MLTREQHSPDIHLTPTSCPVEVETIAECASSSCEDLLEDAVDQACAPLIGTMPRADRMVGRAALRQELDTLVAAHGELDANPECAISEALAHFARLHPVPDLRVTQGHIQESAAQQTTRTRPKTSAWPATLLALGLFVPVCIVCVLNGAENMREAMFRSQEMYRLELFVAPLLAGLLVGLLARSHAVRGVLIACAAITTYTIGMPSLLSALSVMRLLGLPAHPLLGWMGIGFLGLVLWPLLGCAGAITGATLRRKAKNALPRIKRMRRIHADSIQK